MSDSTLAKELAGWIGTILHDPGAPGRDHCFQLRPHFRIPGTGRVDLLTIRHELGAPDRFRVDLWNILSGSVRDRDVDGMMRCIHAFQAWYAELIEHAETQGFSAGHRLTVHGNLIGKSISRSRFVDLLSHWGSTMFFWTWTRSAAGLEILPAYDREPALGSARTQLKSLLDHLPWEDSADREDAVPDSTQATF